MPHETPLTIGILALQGAYDAHARVLTTLGATPRLVRTPEALAEIDALIIPGGESTTILKFLERDNFFEALQDFVHTKPTFGTCAGAILLAKDVANSTQRSLDALDITVERNAYGRQNDSTILTEVTSLQGGPLEMVFIRAPAHLPSRPRHRDPRHTQRRSCPHPLRQHPRRHISPGAVERPAHSTNSSST